MPGLTTPASPPSASGKSGYGGSDPAARGPLRYSRRDEAVFGPQLAYSVRRRPGRRPRPRTPEADRDALVSETTRPDADAEDLVVRRTTTQPVGSLKVQWPRTLHRARRLWPRSQLLVDTTKRPRVASFPTCLWRLYRGWPPCDNTGKLLDWANDRAIAAARPRRASDPPGARDARLARRPGRRRGQKREAESCPPAVASAAATPACRLAGSQDPCAGELAGLQAIHR